MLSIGIMMEFSETGHPEPKIELMLKQKMLNPVERPKPECSEEPSDTGHNVSLYALILPRPF